MDAIAVLVLFGIGYFALARKPAPSAAVAIRAPTMAAATMASSSIAVLPLENLSRDPVQQYFSDDLSESLITALAQIPPLKVIGKSSSFLFPGLEGEQPPDRRAARRRSLAGRQRRALRRSD
ncbi:MAG TPA: hypothetical protein VMV68_08520, partial [Spirochaetia bacterium]|nr:hypothetical protein [Spirochaetia bacterium]